MKTTSQQTERSPASELRFGSVVSTIVLGIAVTALTLFVEVQLLKATNLWPDGDAASQQSVASTERRHRSIDGPAEPPLRVHARSIVPKPGTSLVSQDR